MQTAVLITFSQEDEWNDMNEVKDYSGLRIATKNITK